jgi:hypothetical protein
MLLGDIGTLLRTKKVYFQFHPVGEMGIFSRQRKFLFHPVGEIGIFLIGKKVLFQPAGEIGTFLMAKKVSFPSCRRNWHLSHGKEISFSIMLVTVLPFSFLGKFVFLFRLEFF